MSDYKVLVESLLHNADQKMLITLAGYGNPVLVTRDQERIAIRRYTAAVAVNFTDWMGKTLPFVRHELSRYALTDNLRCESVENHVGMLLDFARSCGSLPDRGDYEDVSTPVDLVRSLFKDPQRAGLNGLILMTLLENTSGRFIPVLETMAKSLGSKNILYTQAHGVADIEHSQAFAKALEAEMGMGYSREEVEGACHLVYHYVSMLFYAIFNTESN